MRKTIFVIIFLFVTTLVVSWLCLSRGKESLKPGLEKLQVGETEVRVELARTPDEWAQGLSGRETLGEDEGMLFVSNQSVRRSFWMKGMRFPLDMLFIHQGRVVDIANKVRAPSAGEDGTAIRVSTWLPAEWVLEVNSGWVERHGVKVGDKVILESKTAL